jgi:hypothetical protein
MFRVYNLCGLCGEFETCLEFIICGQCRIGCDMFGDYNMWRVCGEDVTCLEFIICGECVERL